MGISIIIFIVYDTYIDKSASILPPYGLIVIAGVYVFYKLNKNQLSIIIKRAFYFRSNPIIRQTFIMTTLKLILRLIRKSIFKV